MDRGAWQAEVHGVTKSWMRLSMHTQVLLAPDLLTNLACFSGKYIAPFHPQFSSVFFFS